MVGTYHQFGAFVSGVASLPRVVIMTMHNIELTPRVDAGADKTKPVGIGPNSTLELKGTVKTYRYRDEEETTSATPAAGGATPAAPITTPAAAPATAVAPPPAPTPPQGGS